MQFNRFHIFLITILIGLTFFSCKKEDDKLTTDLIETSWEVLKIKKQGESKYTDAENTYVMEFTGKTEFELNLDVNTCFGDYELKSDDYINFKSMACTEMCCDSEFAMDLSKILLNITEYYKQGDELIFKGEGEIVLKAH
ncbi:MAG: META domain-containing protein [Bacteroidota bacterium]